jgi:hypothetical protein
MSRYRDTSPAREPTIDAPPHCDDIDCLGWVLMNRGEANQGIQRCDSCKVFASDAEAQEQHAYWVQAGCP